MLIDRKKALLELDMQEEMFNDLLNMFIEQTEPAVRQLEVITSPFDYEAIRKTAHYINGSAASMRIEAVQSIAGRIEVEASDKQDIIMIKDSIMKLKDVFEALKKEIAEG